MYWCWKEKLIDCVLCLGVTIFEVAEARAGDKRKREKPGDPGDIEGYKGEVNKETNSKFNLYRYICWWHNLLGKKTFCTCTSVMSQTGDLCTWIRSPGGGDLTYDQ